MCCQFLENSGHLGLIAALCFKSLSMFVKNMLFIATNGEWRPNWRQCVKRIFNLISYPTVCVNQSETLAWLNGAMSCAVVCPTHTHSSTVSLMCDTCAPKPIHMSFQRIFFEMTKHFWHIFTFLFVFAHKNWKIFSLWKHFWRPVVGNEPYHRRGYGLIFSIERDSLL